MGDPPLKPKSAPADGGDRAPGKLYFRIGEVAALVGVEPHVLRYWEREFRTIRPTKSAKGQRVYSRKDVENLLRVRDLLYRDGFTIAGAKKKLAGSPLAVGSAPPPQSASSRAGLVETASADAGADPDPEPDPPPPATDPRDRVREKLLALRREVESFLADLSAGPGAARGPKPVWRAVPVLWGETAADPNLARRARDEPAPIQATTRNAVDAPAWGRPRLPTSRG